MRKLFFLAPLFQLLHQNIVCRSKLSLEICMSLAHHNTPCSWATQAGTSRFPLVQRQEKGFVNRSHVLRIPTENIYLIYVDLKNLSLLTYLFPIATGCFFFKLPLHIYETYRHARSSVIFATFHYLNFFDFFLLPSS